MRKVVEVHLFAPRLGDSPFNLRPFMPFVERCYRDDLWPGRQCCDKRVLVVFPINAVPCVLGVPWPNTSVDVTRPYTWYEQQVIIITEGFNGSPVVLRGTVSKAIGGEIRVESIKSAI